MTTTEARIPENYAYSVMEVEDDENDEDDECEGHQSLDGAYMGAAFYCDGTCRHRRKPMR